MRKVPQHGGIRDDVPRLVHSHAGLPFTRVAGHRHLVFRRLRAALLVDVESVIGDDTRLQFQQQSEQISSRARHVDRLVPPQDCDQTVTG